MDRMRKIKRFLKPRKVAKIPRHRKNNGIDFNSKNLVDDYERLSKIVRKAKNISELQKKLNEMQLVGRYKKLKQDLRDKTKYLEILLKGDRQRTEESLKLHLRFQRAYKDMQSYEVLDEMDYQAFKMRKKYDRYVAEKNRREVEYNELLLEISKCLETIRNFSIRDFKEDRRTKELLAAHKNSKTRIRAIQKLNKSYNQTIFQLLHDPLFYKPVLTALNAGLVEQTADIGTKNHYVKKVDKDLNRLKKVTKRGEIEKQIKIAKNLKEMKNQPKLEQILNHHDPDFNFLGDLTDPNELSTIQSRTESVDPITKMLGNDALCDAVGEIFPNDEFDPQENQKIQQKMAKKETIQDEMRKKKEIAKFVHDLLVDDLQIYNEEKMKEVFVLKNAIKLEQEKQEKQREHLKTRGDLSMTLRVAIHQMLDVLQPVGSSEFSLSPEIPQIDLKILISMPHSDSPKQPMALETNTRKLLCSLKSRVKLLLQLSKNDKTSAEIQEVITNFQELQSIKSFRPKAESFDYD